VISLPHLETNITIACQNRCVACNHFVPLQTRQFKASMVQPAALAEDFYHFGRVAHTAIWAPIGGEPLLHPKINEILRIAHSAQIADEIEVRTNGQALHKMVDEFWYLVDALIVTVYPGKMTDADVGQIRTKCVESGVRLEVMDLRASPDFVRLLEPATDPAATARKYATCWFKTYCRVLDNGWFYRCCTTPFIPKLLLGLPEGTDGLRVDKALTESTLQAFLDQPEAPISCQVCVGMGTPATTPIGWREVKDPSEWLAASGSGMVQ
jgi:hypothetical protein